MVSSKTNRLNGKNKNINGVKREIVNIPSHIVGGQAMASRAQPDEQADCPVFSVLRQV
jgi:hypothetical protein